MQSKEPVPTKRQKTESDVNDKDVETCIDLAYGMLELADKPDSITGMIREGKYLYAVIKWAKREKLPREDHISTDTLDG